MRPSSVASAVYLLAVLVLLFSSQMYGADAHASTTDSSRPSVPLAGLPTGATRYVTLDSLLALPLVTYTGPKIGISCTMLGRTPSLAHARL